jgi:hypothetical protein
VIHITKYDMYKVPGSHANVRGRRNMTALDFLKSPELRERVRRDFATLE